MHLIVNKKNHGEVQKVWKLSSKKHLHVIGSSKKADLYLPLVNTPVWMGLEYRNDGWYLVNFSEKNDFVEKKINENSEFDFDGFSLELKPIDTSRHLIDLNSSLQDTQLLKTHVLVMFLEGKQVIKSELYTEKEFSKSYTAFRPENNWQSYSPAENQLIYFKKVSDHSPLIPLLLKSKKEKDKGLLTLQIISFLTICFGLLFYLFLPNNKSASEVAIQSIPPKIQINRQIKMTPKKEKVETSETATSPAQTQQKEQAQIAQQKPQKDLKPTQASAPSSALGNKSRLSQMIARISGNKPTSKNLVVVSNPETDKPSQQIQAATIANEIGGTAKGLGQIGGSTGVNVGTLSNQGTGSKGQGLSQVSGQLTGAGGSAAASALDEEADVEGGLDPEIIASFIRTRLGEILHCYERQLTSNPNLYGKVAVRFIIGANGQVDSSRVTQTSLKNASVESCVIQRISRWKFPLPKGGTQVIVTYPFMFKNAN